MPRETAFVEAFFLTSIFESDPCASMAPNPDYGTRNSVLT